MADLGVFVRSPVAIGTSQSHHGPPIDRGSPLLCQAFSDGLVAFDHGIYMVKHLRLVFFFLSRLLHWEPGCQAPAVDRIGTEAMPE